jgi:hypothetical protein
MTRLQHAERGLYLRGATRRWCREEFSFTPSGVNGLPTVVEFAVSDSVPPNRVFEFRHEFIMGFSANRRLIRNGNLFDNQLSHERFHVFSDGGCALAQNGFNFGWKTDVHSNCSYYKCDFIMPVSPSHALSLAAGCWNGAGMPGKPPA